jgi:1-acyl-sn-glycerol-3-phosphate acyltransferase
MGKDQGMNSATKPARRFAVERPLPVTGAIEHKYSPSGGVLLRRARVVRRMVSIALWTFVSIPIQSVCLLLPGQAKVHFARVYWGSFAWLMGISVRRIGERARQAEGRSVLFVSNHSSWLDIPVLGGQLDACFVAKDEVGSWPVIRTIARLGRSVFVSRGRGSIGRERNAMVDRLAAGDNLLLFPEGTTSDGARVLPFRSSFFAIAEGEHRPIVQPVSIVYDRLGGLPTGRANRPLFSWYGDMDIASHFWQIGQYRGMRCTVVLHAPLDPARFADRKALAQAVWKACADGAATLRQNRPAQPILAPAPEAAVGDGQPVFA